MDENKDEKYLLPIGTYKCRARKAVFGFSGEGNEQIAIWLEVIEDSDYKGRFVLFRGSFTEKALTFTIQSLRSLGFDPGKHGWGALCDVDEGNIDLIFPLECSAVVQHTEYQGKTYARARFLNRSGPPPLGADRPLSPTQKRAFAARMQAFASSVPLLAKPSIDKDGRKTEAKVSEDDIPF